MSEKEPGAKVPSKKQLEVFHYVEEYINNNVFSPSYREIRDALGLKSISPVAAHIDALVALGYLEKQDNAARSLRVIKSSRETTSSSETAHLDWLRQEIAKREVDGKLSKEGEIIKAALTVLDQSEEK